MDSSYYYYEYSPELGRKLVTKIYSDTTVSLLELARKEGLPPSPLLSSINPLFRTELSKHYLVTTTVAQNQVNRVVYSGNFTFSGSELTGGTVTDLILSSNDGTVRGISFTTPASYQQLASIGVSKAISGSSGQPLTSPDKFDRFFPDGWSTNPFGQDLVSTKTITAYNIFTTTSDIDKLTGVARQKDIFQFLSEPGYGAQADSIAGFSTRNKDQIRLSTKAFGVAKGSFAIAGKTRRARQLLASDTNFIYNQKSGELIFNANGTEPGSGDDGGVFAVLVDRPSLMASSLSFI